MASSSPDNGFQLLLLSRTAWRCRRAYILPLWFFFLSFFFFFDASSIRSLNGSQANLDTYSLMTAIWKIWSQLPGHLPPRAGGIAFGDRLWHLTEHTSAVEQDINNRKETCQSTWTPVHAPKFVNFGRETAENDWWVFAHPQIFAFGDTASLTTWTLYSRQQANFGTCYVVARAYSLEQQNGRAGSRWALPCI